MFKVWSLCSSVAEVDSGAVCVEEVLFEQVSVDTTWYGNNSTAQEICWGRGGDDHLII